MSCSKDGDTCLHDDECCGGDCHKPSGQPTGNCRQEPGNHTGGGGGGAGGGTGTGTGAGTGAGAGAPVGQDPLKSVKDFVNKNPMEAVGIAAIAGILLARMR